MPTRRSQRQIAAVANVRASGHLIVGMSFRARRVLTNTICEGFMDITKIEPALPQDTEKSRPLAARMFGSRRWEEPGLDVRAVGKLAATVSCRGGRAT